MRTSPRATTAVRHQPLPCREPRVQHCDLLAGEAPLDARHRLPGEAYLGDEEQHRAPRLERGLCCLQVHLRLAAARDAVEKHLVAAVRLAQDGVQGTALLVQEVRHVGEGGAGLQAARLSGGGGRDVRGRSRPRPTSVALPAGLLGSERLGLQQPAQAGGGEPAGGAQFALLQRAGLLDQGERRPLPGPQPARRPGASAQQPAGRGDADHVHAVGDPQPLLAPVALRGRRQAAALEPETGQLVELALSGVGGRPAGLRELVLAHDFERPGGWADERQRGRKGGEVVPLHPACHVEEFGGDRRDAQDIAQRQDASPVGGGGSDLEDDADDRLRAERYRDQRPRTGAPFELARNLVVEGLGEGPCAYEREDGGVARTAPQRAHGAGLRRLTARAAPPSARRRRLRP